MTDNSDSEEAFKNWFGRFKNPTMSQEDLVDDEWAALAGWNAALAWIAQSPKPEKTDLQLEKEKLDFLLAKYYDGTATKEQREQYVHLIYRRRNDHKL